MSDHKVRIKKKGDADISKGDTVSVRGGKRRAIKSESLVSLVRGAIRSLSPNIKDRRERIEDAVEGGIRDANRISKRKKQ